MSPKEIQCHEKECQQTLTTPLLSAQESIQSQCVTMLHSRLATVAMALQIVTIRLRSSRLALTDTYIRVHKATCTHIHRCTQGYMYTHTYVYTRLHVHTYICIHKVTCTYVYTRLHVHTYICVHKVTCTYVYTRLHVHVIEHL